LYGPISPRKRDIELILRFLALFHESENYEKPIKEFLNTYMDSNRHLSKQSEEVLLHDFIDTVRVIESLFGSKAFKPKKALNAAIFDSVMVGMARRLLRGAIIDEIGIRSKFNELLSDPEYKKVTETGTSDEDIVRRRLEIATKAFEDVE